MKLKKVFMQSAPVFLFLAQVVTFEVNAFTVKGAIIPNAGGFSCLLQFSCVPAIEDIGGVQLDLSAKPAFNLTDVVATAPDQGAWSQISPSLIRGDSHLSLSSIAPAFLKSASSDTTTMFQLQLNFTGSNVPANYKDVIDSLTVNKIISTSGSNIQNSFVWGTLGISSKARMSKEVQCTYSNKLYRVHQLMFNLKSDAVIKAKVVDVSGKTLKVLLNSKLAAGMHTVGWDGSLSSHSSAASGIYFLQLETGAFTYNKKVSHLK